MWAFSFQLGASQHATCGTHQRHSDCRRRRRLRLCSVAKSAGCFQLRQAFAPAPFAQEHCLGQPRGQHRAFRVCYIYGVGGVASFNGTYNVWAPPPNNSVKRTAFRGRLPRALEGGVALFISGVVRRNMQRMARTSTRTASAGIGAAVARTACGGITCASVSTVASTRRVAFATLTALAASLCFASRPTCGHRRLTTHSSGRAARAAKFKR